MVRIWSQPTPVRRSASARHSAGDGGGPPSRRSSTTKSLPAPCILLNRMPGARCPGPALIGSLVVDRLGRRRVRVVVIDRRYRRPGGLGAGRHGRRRYRRVIFGKWVRALSVVRFFGKRILAVPRLNLLVVDRRRGHEQVGLVAAGGEQEGAQRQGQREGNGGFHAGSVAAAAAPRNAGCSRPR